MQKEESGGNIIRMRPLGFQRKTKLMQLDVASREVLNDRTGNVFLGGEIF
jgi:hypothetical protein